MEEEGGLLNNLNLSEQNTIQNNETEHVISSNSPLLEWNVLLTTITLKDLSYQ